jgi:prepilin-type N-terminal cleavage/methylation domain-containing protein
MVYGPRSKVFFSPAFTLIELLVVIAIIAILIIILWAAVRNAIADAKVKTAKSEMHEIVSAVTQYYQEYEKLPVPNADQGGTNKAYSGASAMPIYQALTGNNPRQRVFLNREFNATNAVMLDPWSMSYVLYFDCDYNNDTSVGSGRTAVRSYGPNRTADSLSYKTSDDILVNE